MSFLWTSKFWRQIKILQVLFWPYIKFVLGQEESYLHGINEQEILMEGIFFFFFVKLKKPPHLLEEWSEQNFI